MASKEKKYFVFISYQSNDVEWAKWLEYELDFYNLPSNLDPNETTNHGEKIRDNLRDVFWDSRLPAGGLDDGIKSKLKSSVNLIVICSPNSANVKEHPWVNEEIKYFIELGKIDHIFPFIVDGKEPKEFFPPALLNLPPNKERVGGNVNKDGKDAAFVKIVAGMLDVDYDVLWPHYEWKKAEQTRLEREKREKLQIAQSRFVAEKAEKLIEEGDSNLSRLLALEILPKNIASPDKPYTPEAEFLLRKSLLCDCNLLRSEEYLSFAKFSPDGKYVIASLDMHSYAVWNVETGECIGSNLNQFCSEYVSYSSDGRRIVSTKFNEGDVCIWNASTNKLLQIIKTGEEDIRHIEYINRDRDLFVKTKGSAIIWSVKKKKAIKRIPIGGFYPSDYAICPLRNLYCYIREGNHVFVKDLYTDVILFEKIEQEKYPVDCVTISSNGHYVGYVIKNRLKVYDINEKQLVFDLDDLITPVVSITINYNGNFLAVGYSNSEKSGIDIWDVIQKKLVSSYQEDVNNYSTIEFAKDNNIILICNHRNKFIRLIKYICSNNKTSKKGHRSPVVSWGIDKVEQLAVTADLAGVVTLWSAEKKCKLLSFDTALHDIKHLAISSKEKRIIIVSGKDVGDDGKYLLRMENKKDNIGGFVSVWDFNGNLVNIAKRFFCLIHKAVFAINCKSLIIDSCEDIVVYKNRKNYFQKSWEIKDSIVELMVSNDEGGVIAISSIDNMSVRLFDIDTNSFWGSFDCMGIEPTSLSISPLGNYIAVGLDNGFIIVWDLQSKEQISSWKASSSMINTITFTIDEQKIISFASIEVIAWDVKTGRKVQVIDDNVGLGGGMGVYEQSITFINERTLLLVTNEGINFYIFDPLQKLIDLTQKQIGSRKLSKEERYQYYLE